MKNILFIVFFFLISLNTRAESNIGTINFQKIFSESIAFNQFIEEINLFKDEQLKIFKKIEDNLKIEKEKLDSSKLILSEDQYNNQVLKYEINVNEYKNKVDLINDEINYLLNWEAEKYRQRL